MGGGQKRRYQAMEWKRDMLSMNLVMDMLFILRRENSRCMNCIVRPCCEWDDPTLQCGLTAGRLYAIL